MSDHRHVGVAVADDGLRTLSLRRAPVNALGRELVEDLENALSALAEDEQARCLVLRSEMKHFCAGADLKERRTMTLDDVRAFVPRLAGICNSIAALPYPTIAAVRGAAAGGGCEMVLACDFRILADDTKIGLRETALAIIPGAGGTQRLPRLVGKGKAKELIFTGKRIAAQEALNIGLVNQVCEPKDLLGECKKMADMICETGPIAIEQAKYAINYGIETDMQTGLAIESNAYWVCIPTEDRLEGLAAFKEKRKPVYKGK